jgi:hypothetical protein
MALEREIASLPSILKLAALNILRGGIEFGIQL